MYTINEIKEMLAMGFTPEQIAMMNQEKPEVANAKAVDTPKEDHAIRQNINLVWSGENLTLQLKAVNASKVHSDLWHVNYVYLRDNYKAQYSKTRGIYWYKKDIESFNKARDEFRVIDCLNVKAQIELENKRIEEYNTKIEYLKKMIAESEAKLEKLENL